MKSWKNILIDSILCVTSILFLLLLCSAIFIFGQNSKFMSYILPMLILCLNIVIFILNIKTTKKGYFVFLTVLFSICSIVMFLVRIGVFSGTIFNWWPFLGIASGLALYCSGFYKYRKVRFEYLIPSIGLLIVGVWFSLFSWKIITIPFIEFIVICGPLLLIMGIVILFVMLYYQKKNKMFIINDDEYNQFEDDDFLKE